MDSAGFIGAGPRFVAILLSLICVALLPVPAAASDHRPPRTLLEVGEKRQPGKPGSYCWTRSAGFPVYQRTCALAVIEFPPARVTEPGREARIVIDKLQPPSQFEVIYWRRVNGAGSPQGRPREISVELRPALRDLEVVWEAVFPVPDRRSDYYILAFGVWMDEEGSFVNQDASWYFHLRVRA